MITCFIPNPHDDEHDQDCFGHICIASISGEYVTLTLQHPNKAPRDICTLNPNEARMLAFALLAGAALAIVESRG